MDRWYIARLEFRCDRREGNEQEQLKPADRLRQYLSEFRDVHVDTLSHAQRLLLCENMQLKTGATGMATDSSVLPGPTTVIAHAPLNRSHRESAAASSVNAACMSVECNCLRNQEVNCMNADRADECSRLPAGAVVDAPLNVSSALSLHDSPSASEQAPSVHNSQLRTEYPPCLSSDVWRGDLSPRVSLCDSRFGESRGNILGLVAAPLVNNAATVPSLQSSAVQCNAISQAELIVS